MVASASASNRSVLPSEQIRAPRPPLAFVRLPRFSDASWRRISWLLNAAADQDSVLSSSIDLLMSSSSSSVNSQDTDKPLKKGPPEDSFAVAQRYFLPVLQHNRQESLSTIIKGPFLRVPRGRASPS